MKSAAVFFLFFSASCFSSDLPFRFFDEKGKEIINYCVAPMYEKYQGITWGPTGHGGGRSDGKMYLMWPNIVIDGDTSGSKIKRIAPYWIPFVVSFGERTNLRGLMILSKDGSPTNVGTGGRSGIIEYTFADGNSNSLIDQLVSDKPDFGIIRKFYNIGTNVSVVIDYSPADKELLKRCYKK